MKYTREVLEQAVAESTSVAGVIRFLGLRPSGGMQAHLSRRIRKFGIDTTHFTGQAHTKGKPAKNRMTWEEILIRRPPGSARVKPHLLRRALIEAGVPYKCAICGLDAEWCGSPLTLHVDHIRGDSLDSRPEEVRFLCPNCHTQTATWAGRNRNFGSAYPDL
ncbi:MULTISPECIES: HNH endonuclease [Rhodococcus]|uniref:HNH endonuclease n=1 Tax=Rhodococcus oxybenzonivorans TaxID=1990687 RepID=A0AAE5A6R5_9NOCA|nr:MULTISPECIES: HNH endonuclease [Rhodococcus]MDV7244544.1 HNH endonuclease [Rhodococcus oxybenzonivorans]MDV7264759.1 HNH endonuclease [Rhodococcus oxybenzonivorans]MDV7274213.1 HNH endonuclease [Rhodococcus oxybenzonivorans]MDV7335595.1 HNH endonuclease [Rhodococcus oxybenzonivorans]MDV7345163.1 HNH endonuclease [Rhodococcus oxybenzonivorans]